MGFSVFPPGSLTVKGVGRSYVRVLGQAVPITGHTATLAPWRGVGMVSADYDDLTTVDVSWWYDWGHLGGDSTPANVALYVPMVWGDPAVTGQGGGSVAEIAGGYTTLLGFNEPDGTDPAHQSNVTVARALALWPELEATGARLGSPAVSVGAGAAAWLADFMAGSPRVDFLCVHWYGTVVADLLAHLASLHATYGLPIWITELAGWDSGSTVTLPENVALAEDVLTALRSVPYVERVAWFPSRAYTAVAGYDNAHLVGSGGALTTVGDEWAAVANGISWAAGVSSVTDWAPAATSVATKIATLVDSFTTLSERRWYSAHADLSGGALRLSSRADYAAFLSSRAVYDLTGSSVSFRAGPDPASSTHLLMAQLRQDRNAANRVEAYKLGGNLDILGVAASSTVAYQSTAYNATAHAWWRVRHDGTTIHLDTSPDGTTWTSTLSFAASTLGWTPDAVELVFVAGFSGSESTPFYVTVGSVNV